jgi:uncharacterized protein (TIGR03066 family)
MQKKSLVVMFAVMAIMLVFSSCKKDDKDLIVGKWQMVRIVEGNYDEDVSSEKLYWTFKADGTFSFQEDTWVDDEGTWSLDGKKLTLTMDGDSEVVTVDELTKKSMVLTAHVEDDGEAYTSTAYFNKI